MALILTSSIHKTHCDFCEPLTTVFFDRCTSSYLWISSLGHLARCLSPSGAQVAITTLVDRGLVAKPLVFLGLLIGAQVAGSQQHDCFFKHKSVKNMDVAWHTTSSGEQCIIVWLIWNCGPAFSKDFFQTISHCWYCTHVSWYDVRTIPPKKVSYLPKDITPISKTINIPPLRHI